MAKLIVTLDDKLINVVSIDKNRMTLGRRPYNDIMVDNLAVSGEHAAIQAIGAEFYVEDLNSTNGTYINGKKIKLNSENTFSNTSTSRLKTKILHHRQMDKALMLMSKVPALMTSSISSKKPVLLKCILQLKLFRAPLLEKKFHW